WPPSRSAGWAGSSSSPFATTPPVRSAGRRRFDSWRSGARGGELRWSRAAIDALEESVEDVVEPIRLVELDPMARSLDGLVLDARDQLVELLARALLRRRHGQSRSVVSPQRLDRVEVERGPDDLARRALRQPVVFALDGPARGRSRIAQ